MNPDEDASPGPVDQLADRFWEGILERHPVIATSLGDERYADRLDDPGPAGRARERAAMEAALSESSAIDRPALTVEDRITLDMLRTVAGTRLSLLDQRLFELDPVDHMNGPQVLPGTLSVAQPIDTEERFEALIARLRGYPTYLQEWIGVLREGIASGRTAAASVMERTIDQIERMLATPVERAPLMARHPELPAPRRERLREAHDRLVYPALARYLEALYEAAPSVRQGDGLWAIPGGDEAYRTLIHANTSLDATPQELHDFGLEQLERIDRERASVARDFGHPDVAALRAELDADPTNRASSGDEILSVARSQLERAMAAAPGWFGRLPRAEVVVEPVEPFREREAAPAFYFPPTADGSRPGIYYINTYDPQSRPVSRLAAMTFHEAVPGHHFQIAIEMELPHLHPFRRHGSRLAGVAYTEGWGLYCERLADEMGLYLSPRERLGMLDAQAWRAGRLVVDTGIHAFRWDRARSIDFLVRTGLMQLEAETETDRYIAMPAQALAYMVGQREIQALRREIAARDGDRFDLRGFHDAVLGHGALPLATLRRELPSWVRPLDG